jgi:IS30 family transposase
MTEDASSCTKVDEVVTLQRVSDRLANGKDRQRFTAANVSDAKRKEIEEALKRGLGIVHIAQDVGASPTTVGVIRDQLIAREPDAFKKHMAGNLQRIANKAAGTIEQAIDDLAQQGLKPNQVPGLSVALGILIDKQAQLLGETPVSVVEVRHSVDPEAIKTALVKLSERNEPEAINVTATATATSESVIAQ